MSLFTPMPSFALVRSELLRNLRKITPLIFLVLIVLFSSGAVIMNWPVNDTVSTLYWQSSSMLVVLIAFLMMLLFVMVPGHAAASIAAERQRGTYEMTRLTLISAGGIVVAKVINTMGLYMLLVLACAPILAVQFFLFGMDWQTLLYAMIVILATAIACASAGVFISSVNSKPAAATILSFAATFVLMGGPLGLLYVVCEIMGLRGFAATLQQWMMSFSPIAVLSESVTSGAGLSEAMPLFFFLAVWSNLFIILAVVAVKKYSSAESDEGSSLGLIRRVWGFVHNRVLGRQYYKRRLPAIPDVLNPVFVVETRWGALTKHGALIRIFLATLVLNLAIGGFICASAIEWGAWAFEYASVVIGMDFFLACLLFPGVLANAFVKEAEQNNMDFLRSTLLTPIELVWGKCAAGLRVMIAFLAGVAFGALSLGPLFLSQPASLPVFVTGFISLIALSLLTLAIGLFSGVVFQRSMPALSLAYFLTALCTIGVFLLGGMFSEFYRVLFIPSRYVSYDELLAFFSPVFGYYYCMSRLDEAALWLYWMGNLAVTLFSAAFFTFSGAAVFAVFRMRDR